MGKKSKAIVKEFEGFTMTLASQIVPKKNSHQIYTRGRNGQRFVGRTARQISSQNELHAEALREWRKKAGPYFELGSKVYLDFVFAYNSHADTVGLAETVLDALEGVMYKNDRVAKNLSMDMLDKDATIAWSVRITLKKARFFPKV